MTKRIRKAIIPAVGLGTRFLPATKAQPKEMLPILNVAMLTGLYALSSKILGDAVTSWTSLMISIWLLGGLQLLSLGLIYKETKQRPKYHVEAVLDSDREPEHLKI